MVKKTPLNCFSDTQNIKNIADNVAEKTSNSSTPPNCYNSSVNLKNIADNIATMDNGGGSGDVPSTRQIIAGDGLTGGGDLSTDRTISLSEQTQASLVKAERAVPATRRFYVMDGLIGMGGEHGPTEYDLSSDFGVGLSLDIKHRLDLAETSFQRIDAGLLAGKDKVDIADINATGTPSVNTYLRGDGMWALPQSSGDGDVPSSRQIIAGDGLAGGGDLTQDRTIALSSTTVEAIAKANTAVQPNAVPHTLIWTAPGSYIFDPPAGTFWVKVRAWGAGGGSGDGASGLLTSSTGGDGGGGGYIEGWARVNHGNVYVVIVGAGGARGAEGSLTSFGGNLLVARGGAGGTHATGSTPGVGGGGGITSFGIEAVPILQVNGTSGRNGVDTDGSNLSQSGNGFGFPGISRYRPSGSYTGTAGTITAQGAEGSAGSSGGNPLPGQSGGAGRVILEWFVPAVQVTTLEGKINAPHQ